LLLRQPRWRAPVHALVEYLLHKSVSSNVASTSRRSRAEAASV
jgi:hypothetical protein